MYGLVSEALKKRDKGRMQALGYGLRHILVVIIQTADWC